MSNPPPSDPKDRPPRKLDYQPPKPRHNSPPLFLLRSVAGVFVGGAALVGGWFLGAWAENFWLLPVPLVLVLAVALVLDLRTDRFGYATGVIVAPILLAGAGVVLLFMICGGWRPF